MHDCDDHAREQASLEDAEKLDLKLEKWKLISELMPQSGVVLDVGCFNGTFSRYFRAHAQAHGIDYIGVNVSSRAIEDAKRKRMDVVLASCDFLPFKDESFDACSLFQVIECLYSPGKPVGEARRILKSDGKLIVTGHNFVDFLNRLNMILGINIIPGSEQSQLIRFFTWTSLNKYLRKRGFDLDERKTWFLPFPLKSTTTKWPLWRRVMTLPAKLFPNLSDSLIGRWRKVSTEKESVATKTNMH